MKPFIINSNTLPIAPTIICQVTSPWAIPAAAEIPWSLMAKILDLVFNLLPLIVIPVGEGYCPALDFEFGYCSENWIVSLFFLAVTRAFLLAGNVIDGFNKEEEIADASMAPHYISTAKLQL